MRPLLHLLSGVGALPALAVALVAWAALLAAHGSPLAPLLDHAVLADRHVPMGLALPGLATGWTLMVAAMMLPGAALTGGRTARSVTWIVAYLAVWLCAGFAFAGLDLVVHGALEPRWPRLAAGLPRATLVLCCSWLTAAVLLAAVPRAAGRQFERPPLEAGWAHGLACLALCWPVMLAMQAVAPGNLVAMAAAGGVSTGVRLVRLVVAGHRLAGRTANG